MVESSSDDILKDADKVDVAFLVVGDPFGYAALTYPPLGISNTS
jgi:diphthamide biosynthesis methyltransferase